MMTAATPTMEFDRPVTRMSMQEKTAAVQPVVRRATECVARNVVDNPRATAISEPGVLGDMIVQSMPSCAELMRTMIDSFDRFFGEGSGEAYFSGPYLDALPAAVLRSANDVRR
jgi:hypothetical protein